MNRTYHPRSWSQQAREKANALYRWIKIEKPILSYRDEEGEFHYNVSSDEYAAYEFYMSYRCDMIRYRAAKRFGRLMRKKSVAI